MKTRYTFTVLRYVHDVVTAEFANVGVVVYAPDARYLQARYVNTFERLSDFFGGADRDHLKQVVGYLELSVKELALRLFSRPAGELPADVMQCAGLVLPADDTALQFAPPGAGLSGDLDRTLSLLYERYVERYDVMKRGSIGRQVTVPSE